MTTTRTLFTGPPAAPSRGQRTRDQLLDAAEQLWGERGVGGVSLREIRIAAGQRNSSALQFHFGDRDGLLLALVQRHLPRVAAIQEELHTELLAAGRGDDLAGLVEVMLRPMAEYMRRGPAERAWIKISAERFAHPGTGLREMYEHAPPVSVDVGGRIFERLSSALDADIALERLLAVLVAASHLCADRARIEDTAPEAMGREPLPFDRWLANLLDMAVSALAAPPGVGTSGPPLLPLDPPPS